MSTRESTLVPLLRRIIHALEHDYRNYKQRSEYAFRVGDNKELPRPAVHELWNAFDHFVRAFNGALKLESRTTRPAKGRHIKNRKVRSDEVLWLEVERGRKHIVAAQFYCLQYSIEKRMQGIRLRLDSPLRGTDNRIVKYRERFVTIEINVKTRLLAVRAPSRQPNRNIRDAQDETKKIMQSNAKMDTDLDKLDNFHSNLSKHYRGKIVVQRPASR